MSKTNSNFGYLQTNRNLSSYPNAYDYGKWLEQYDWDYFCTFTTPYELTLKSSRRMMDFLALKFLLGPESKMFWAAEKFDVKEGYHIHALIQSMMKQHMISDRYKELYHGRPRVLKYDSNKGGNYYFSKYITKQIIDYDFIG